MSIEDGMKEYKIIIEEGCAGMGEYKATLSYQGGGEETMTVHHRSEAGVRSFIYYKKVGGPDFSTGLKRIGPVNPGEYVQGGMDERDAVSRLVRDKYYDDSKWAEANIDGMNPDQITKEIYQKCKNEEGVQIILPPQMDLFEQDV